MFISSFIHIHGLVTVTAHIWRSEDNSMGLVLSFHQAGPRDGTQVLRLAASALSMKPLLLSFYFLFWDISLLMSMLALNLGSSCPYLWNSWNVRPSRQFLSLVFQLSSGEMS